MTDLLQNILMTGCISSKILIIHHIKNINNCISFIYCKISCISSCNLKILDFRNLTGSNNGICYDTKRISDSGYISRHIINNTIQCKQNRHLNQ